MLKKLFVVVAATETKQEIKIFHIFFKFNFLNISKEMEKVLSIHYFPRFFIIKF